MDVHTGVWYTGFYYELSEVSRFEVRNDTILRLYNEADAFSVYLLKRAIFEKSYYNLGSLYAK